jgi:hypothetical protein
MKRHLLLYLTGAAKPTIMPKLSGQFSYHQEVVIPRYAQAYENQVK